MAHAAEVLETVRWGSGGVIRLAVRGQRATAKARVAIHLVLVLVVLELVIVIFVVDAAVVVAGGYLGVRRAARRHRVGARGRRPGSFLRLGAKRGGIV